MKATSRWASLLSVAMLVTGLVPLSAFASGTAPVQTGTLSDDPNFTNQQSYIQAEQVDSSSTQPEILSVSPNPYILSSGYGPIVMTFNIPQDEYVTIRVRSVATGQVVKTLTLAEFYSGPSYYGYDVFWNGTDDRFQPCPVGEYVFEVETMLDLDGTSGGVATSEPIVIKNPEFSHVEVYGPNTFNPEYGFVINYELDGYVQDVRLEIINSEGVPVHTLKVSGNSGRNVEGVEGIDDNGNTLTDGTYTFHLTAFDGHGNILSEANGGPLIADSTLQ